MRLWLIELDAIVAPGCMARIDNRLVNFLAALSEHPAELVAILTDLNLDEAVVLAPFPHAIVGGNSGIEWLLPSGTRIGSAGSYDPSSAKRSFRKLLTHLNKLSVAKSLILKEKDWSVTITIDSPAPNSRTIIVNKLIRLANRHGLTCYVSSDKVDIQLIKGVNKSFGVSYLARTLNLDPQFDSLVYVTHADHLSELYWWVSFFGGRIINVGETSTNDGVLNVDDNDGLAELMISLQSPCSLS